MSTSSNERDSPNPFSPFDNAWDKQQKQLPPAWETAREWHDHLSALTWSDQPAKEKPVKMDDAFPSAFVKADQISNPVEVVIDRVEMHQFQDEGQKPVAYFRGKDAGVVLNKRRFAALVELCRSEESDDWAGHPVVLTREPSTHPNAQWMLKFERSKHDKPDGDTNDSEIPF